MATETKTTLLQEFFKKEDYETLLNTISNQDPVIVQGLIRNIEDFIKAKTKSSSKLTYTQLRNIFEIVKDKKFEGNVAAFVLILPKLAYVEARQSGEGKELVNFIRELAAAVTTPADYTNFIEIMTALVAYHKLHV